MPARIGLGEELGQLGQTVIHFIKSRRNDQRPALQNDQARGAGEQVLWQLASPFQKARYVIADQQLFLSVTLQVVGSDLRLAGP